MDAYLGSLRILASLVVAQVWDWKEFSGESKVEDPTPLASLSCGNNIHAVSLGVSFWQPDAPTKSASAMTVSTEEVKKYAVDQSSAASGKRQKVSALPSTAEVLGRKKQHEIEVVPKSTKAGRPMPLKGKRGKYASKQTGKPMTGMPRKPQRGGKPQKPQRQHGASAVRGKKRKWNK